MRDNPTTAPLEEILFFLGKQNYIPPMSETTGPLGCQSVSWTGRNYTFSLFFDDPEEYRWVFQNRRDNTYYHETCLVTNPPSMKLTQYLKRTIKDCQ